MARKWYAATIACGPGYVEQIETWAHDIRRARGRPYVHADYAPVQDVAAFLRQRPVVYKKILEECAQVGRLQVVLTDVDARFQKEFFAPPADVCGIYRRERKLYLPGLVVVRWTDAGQRFLDLWASNEMPTDAERLTDAIARAKADGVTVEDLPEPIVDLEEPGKPLDDQAVVRFLADGRSDIRVTPETVGRAIGSATPVLID